MRTGIHAVSWAFERLAIVAGLLIFAVLIAYTVLVIGIVVQQALTGQ
jgi:hypothetical protein